MSTDDRSAHLIEIGQALRVQDNASTSHPIFLVQQRKRDYGYDPEYSDNRVWLTADEGLEIDDPEELARINDEYRRAGRAPEDYTLTAYHDRWEFVQPFFTRAGAEQYIKANAHRLTDPRIYVDSGYRNHEWQALRAALMGLTVQVAK